MQKRTERAEENLVAEELLILDATELIATLMHELHITKSDLAERVQTTRGHVTQLLSGNRNMTLRTLADLAYAMGHRVTLGCASWEGAVPHVGARPTLPITAGSPPVLEVITPAPRVLTGSR